MFAARAGRSLHDRDLVARFRRVRVHQRVVLVRQARRPPPAARASTTPRSAARTPRAGGRRRRRASGCGSRCSRRSSARVSSCRRRGHLGVEVHHALADRRAQAALGDRLEDHVGVVHRLHRQHRRRAAATAARSSPAAPPRAAIAGVCAASIGQTRVRSQSISGEVVGVAAKQRLAQMDVRLNQAGQHVAAARRRSTRSCGRDGRGPIARDPAVADRDVALDDVEAVVHRDDRCRRGLGQRHGIRSPMSDFRLQISVSDCSRRQRVRGVHRIDAACGPCRA